MILKSLLRSLVSGIALMAICAVAEDKAKDTIDPKLLPPVSTKQGVTFAADIGPMFAKSCFPCHSPKKTKPSGKLTLDTLANVLKGGTDGPILVVGDSAKSMVTPMISLVGDPDEFMPPTKAKKFAPLTKEQVGLVRAWIDQGAK
jgi:hypothetical protein